MVFKDNLKVTQAHGSSYAKKYNRHNLLEFNHNKTQPAAKY